MRNMAKFQQIGSPSNIFCDSSLSGVLSTGKTSWNYLSSMLKAALTNVRMAKVTITVFNCTSLSWCFCPKLVMPLSKSAQIALGWDMWLHICLCRVGKGLAPKVSELAFHSDLPWTWLFHHRSSSFSRYKHLSIPLSPTEESQMNSPMFSYVSGAICQYTTCCFSVHRLCHLHTACMLTMGWEPTPSPVSMSSVTEWAWLRPRSFRCKNTSDTVCCGNKLACL